MFTWSGTKNLVLSRMGSCFSPLYRSMMTCRGDGEDRLVQAAFERPQTGRTYNSITANMTFFVCLLPTAVSRRTDGHLIFCCGVLLGLLFHRQDSRWTDQAFRMPGREREQQGARLFTGGCQEDQPEGRCRTRAPDAPPQRL